MKQPKFLALAAAIALAGCMQEEEPKSEFYELEMPLEAHSEELKLQVAETRAKYEENVIKIKQSADASIADVILKIDTAIAEDTVALTEQQALYDANCTTDELKGSDQCNDIAEGIVNIQNVIKQSQNAKENIRAQAENSMNNHIAAHKSQYKNNLLQLAEQASVSLELNKPKDDKVPEGADIEEGKSESTK